MTSILDRKEISNQQLKDINNAMDYFGRVSEGGSITLDDLPTLYGDGSRWKTLTIKGFEMVYKCYIAALIEVYERSVKS